MSAKSTMAPERAPVAAPASAIQPPADAIHANSDRLQAIEPTTQTHCPFLRSALKAGLLQTDGKTAAIGQITDVLGEDFGRVPAFFARKDLKPEGAEGFFARDRYDPFHTVGSNGDHAGSSGILSADGFDPVAFEKFFSHSADGKTMNNKDMAAAIADMNRADPDASRLVDRSLSSGEFALLLETFGRGQGEERAVDIQEMRALFEESVFPEGWMDRVGEASALGWSTRAASIGTAAQLDGVGMDSAAALGGVLGGGKDVFARLRTAVGAPGAATAGLDAALGATPGCAGDLALEGARSHSCPAGARAVASQSEIESIHGGVRGRMAGTW